MMLREESRSPNTHGSMWPPRGEMTAAVGMPGAAGRGLPWTVADPPRSTADDGRSATASSAWRVGRAATVYRTASTLADPGRTGDGYAGGSTTFWVWTKVEIGIQYAGRRTGDVHAGWW